MANFSLEEALGSGAAPSAPQGNFSLSEAYGQELRNPRPTRQPDAMDFLSDIAKTFTRNAAGLAMAPYDLAASLANLQGGADPDTLRAMIAGGTGPGANPMAIRLPPEMEQGKTKLPTSGDMLTNLGVTPAMTDAGRITGTGMSAFLGPGSMLSRGGQALGSTLGGLFANKFLPGNGVAEFGGLLAGGALGGIPGVLGGPGAAEKLAASKLGEGGRSSLEALEEAIQRMNAAKAQGTTLSAGQAAPELAGLEGSLYRSNPNTLQPFYNAQNESAAATAAKASSNLTGLPGKTGIGQSDLESFVTKAADARVKTAIQERQDAARAAGFTAADAESIPAPTMQPILEKIDAAIAAEPGKIKPVLESLRADLTSGDAPEMSIAKISKAYNVAKDIFEGKPSAIAGAEASAIEKGQKRALGPIVEDLNAALKTNANWAKGAAEFERLTPAIVDMTERGLGKLSEAGPGQLSEIVRGMSSLKRQEMARALSTDPAHRDAVPAIMQGLLNDAITDAGKRAQSFGAFMAEGMQGRMGSRLNMVDAAMGDSYLALKDFATALPGGEQRWGIFQKVLDTLALQKQPGLNSATMENAKFAATLANTTERPFQPSPGVTGAGGALGAAVGGALGSAALPGAGTAAGAGAGAAAGAYLARIVESQRQAIAVAANSDKFKTLLTDPQSLEKLRPLLLMSPGSDRAQQLVRTVLFAEGASDAKR